MMREQLSASCRRAYWLFTVGPFGVLAAITIIRRCITYNRSALWLHWVFRWTYYDLFWLLFICSLISGLIFWYYAFLLRPRYVRCMSLLAPIVSMPFAFTGLYDAVSPSTYGYPWLFAQMGFASEQVKMALHMGFSGGDIEEDHREEIYWLRRAAQNGSLDGEVALYRSLLQKPGPNFNGYISSPEALKWLRLAAHRRDPLAESDLACIYEHKLEIPGAHGTAKYWRSRARADRFGERPRIDEFYAPLCHSDRD
jgi:hypothetical protein